jgi:hypothetical protein
MALKLTKKADDTTKHKWVEFDEDTKILLASLRNDEYQVGLERMRRRIQRNDARFEEGQLGVVDGEITEHKNHCMLLAHFIIKDWAGVQGAEGEPLKYSPQAATELLESNIDFFVFVINEASKVTTQAQEELEETVGKPSPASSGKASGAARPRKGARSTSA